MSNVAGPIPALQVRYELLRSGYDRAAMRYKLLHRIISLIANVSSWITLLTVVFALLQPAGSPVPHIVLHILTPIFGSFGFLATVVLLFVDFHGRWRHYRLAAEKLRGECMRFRAQLAPYAGPDAAAVFERSLEQIEARANSRKGEPLLDQFRWAYYWWGLRWLPDYLRNDLPHTPDQSQSLRRAATFAEEEKAVLNGRLESQQRWHLLRARQFCRRWAFGFQLPILLIHAGNIYWGVFIDRFLEVVAISTSWSMFLYALRDLLDYGPLFNRYLSVAGNLRDVRTAYLERARPFDVGNDDERLRLLAEYTERILTRESEYFIRH